MTNNSCFEYVSVRNHVFGIGDTKQMFRPPTVTNLRASSNLQHLLKRRVNTHSLTSLFFLSTSKFLLTLGSIDLLVLFLLWNWLIQPFVFSRTADTPALQSLGRVLWTRTFVGPFDPVSFLVSLSQLTLRCAVFSISSLKQLYRNGFPAYSMVLIGFVLICSPLGFPEVRVFKIN